MVVKSDYNQTYYRKHRQKLLHKAKTRYKQKQVWRPNLIKILTIILYLGITAFLIKELSEAYATQGWVKALLLEGSIAVLVLYPISPTRRYIRLNRALIGSIYLYSLWTIANIPINRFVEITATDNEMLLQRQYIHKELEVKSQLRTHYLEFKAYRRASYLSDQINKSLHDLKKLPTVHTTRPVLLNELINSIVLRILLMISSVLCLKRLKS